MKQKDLKPSDRVMVRLGAKTQRNEATGEDVIIDPEKDMDVPFSYFKAVTERPDGSPNDDEYYTKTGFYRPIGRTVKLLGTAEATTEKDENGQDVTRSKAVPFEK